MLDALRILALHDHANRHWHNPVTPAPQPESPFEHLVLDQHRANFDLWHREDEARDPGVPDHTIVQAKRDIDTINQRRNDLVEQLDLTLLAAAPILLADHLAEVPLHSETPGLMIDRLSILALKIVHTEEESHRVGATPEHHQRNRERLAFLHEQRHDLAACLSTLWSDISAARRRFKLYRQLKMYNDPSLNPVLYNKPSSTDT